MFKRNTVHTSLLSAFAMLCLFSGVTAQKGNQSTTGAPLKGVDVKLGKNPGGSPAARTTDSNGKINWGVLAKGHYYLIVAGPTKQNAANSNASVNDDIYVVEITGAVGGPIKRGWDPKKKQAFTLPTSAQSKAAPEYKDTITFDSDGNTPCKTTIVKLKSNISNN